jgi:hypothetical protein
VHMMFQYSWMSFMTSMPRLRRPARPVAIENVSAIAPEV